VNAVLQPATQHPGAGDYRDAMARLAAAVTIVTTDGPAGRAGFTATAVCSVTDTPPTLLVCIKHSSSAYAAVTANGVLCVNTLAPGQEALGRRFGNGMPMVERFAEGQWRIGATGSPQMQGAATRFDCRIVRAATAGTHDVLFCEVVEIAVDPDAGAVVYFDRAFHALGKG
jgi:flavin reductase